MTEIEKASDKIEIPSFFMSDIMKVLSNKERKVYDVQVFFTKTTKDEKYPIIGYLHHGKDRFSWTKDR